MDFDRMTTDELRAVFVMRWGHVSRKIERAAAIRTDLHLDVDETQALQHAIKKMTSYIGPREGFVRQPGPEARFN
jgi:hypothetical protein